MPRPRRYHAGGLEEWGPVGLVGFAAALAAAVTIYHLRRHGVGTLDNDAYSYVAGWQWVCEHGLFGPPRPLTGNMPKPFLVVLYGVLFSLGGSGVAINALAVLGAGAAAALIFAVGRHLHSALAGLFAAGLLVLQGPFSSAAVTANSTLLLVAFVLGAYYVRILLWPGAARAYLSLGLLLMAGLCRPDGWLLYVLIWPFCLLEDRSAAAAVPASLWVLLPALFAPGLMLLLDQALFGDWLYSFRSYDYFCRHFPAVYAPRPWSPHLAGSYLGTLLTVFGAVYPLAGLAVLLPLGACVLAYTRESRPHLILLLAACAAILVFHVNTFRTGFFPERFVLIPLTGAALLCGVGLASPWCWLDRKLKGRGLRARMASSGAVCATLAAALLFGSHTAAAGVAELEQQDTLTGFLARAAAACAAETERPVRVLVDNPWYGPLRFHVPPGSARFDRLIEDWRPASRRKPIAGYHVLCLGLPSPDTVPLIAAAIQRPGTWRMTRIESPAMKPLHLFVRTPRPAAVERRKVRYRSGRSR